MVNYWEMRLAQAYLSLDENRMADEAIQASNRIGKVLEKYPNHWNAHFSMARLLLYSGTTSFEKEGLKMMQQLIDRQERLPKEAKFSCPYWEMGRYYYGHENDAAAEKILKRGLESHPHDPELRQEIDSDGRIIKKTLAMIVTKVVLMLKASRSRPYFVFHQ